MSAGHCTFAGCQNKVIGGFQKEVSASSISNPNATIKTTQRLWCAEHESTISGVNMGQGYFLRGRELKEVCRKDD